jgi:hypothetical protein
MSMLGTDCAARTQLAFAPSLRGLGDPIRSWIALWAHLEHRAADAIG